jgi:hypothetical protein
MSYKKQKMSVLLFALFFVALFFVIVPLAHAGGDGVGATVIKAVFLNPILRAIEVGLLSIEWIFAQLLKVAIYLVVLGLEMDKTLTSLHSDGFVVVGWTIIRDFANLGFVLGIIIIALATILRVKEYTASQILWKLVVAALLVNFSLAIAMPFLTLSQSFSDIFLSNISGKGASDNVSVDNQISKRFENFSGAHDLVASANNQRASSSRDEDEALYQDIATSGVSIFFIAAIFLIFLGLAVSLIFRYFMVAFLLVLSPAAWLLWIFPKTAENFKKWWDKFIEWVFFPPIVLFFVYLALKVQTSEGQVYDQAGSAITSAGYITLNIIGKVVLSIAFLLGGMIAASKIGGEAAKMSTGGAQKVVDYTKGKAKEYGTRSGARMMQGGARIMQSGVGQKAVGGTGRVLGKIPFVGGRLQQKTIEAQQSFEKATGRPVEDAKKRFASYSDQQLRDAWKSGNGRDRAAMLDVLASKNKLGLVSDLATHQDYLKSYDILRRGGNGKAVNDIAKQQGMSEDMMILATGGKVYEKDKDGRVKTDSSGEPIEMTYEDAAEKFYSKLDKKDWTTLAKTSGGSLLKGDSVLGFDKNQAELIRKHYIKNMLSDETGKAISGTAPGLKDSKSLEAFYQTMLHETAEEANQLSKDPRWSEMMAKAMEDSKGDRERLVDEIEAGVGLAPKSVSAEDKARLARRLKRLKRSMSSALGGFYESGDGLEGEKKSGDDKEKKSEGKK